MENGWVERKSLCLTGFTVGSKVDWEKLGETHLGAGVSRRSWACKHCFQDLILGQFWQFSSTLVSVTWLCTCRISKHTAHFDISRFDMKNHLWKWAEWWEDWGFEKILTSSPFLSLCCSLACLLALLLLAHFFHLSALTESLAGTHRLSCWSLNLSTSIFNPYSWLIFTIPHKTNKLQVHWFFFKVFLKLLWRVSVTDLA